MEFDIKDSISFVKTLTRNVISLWGEVSFSRQTDISPANQSNRKYLSCDLSELPDLTDPLPMQRDGINRKATRKQLAFKGSDNRVGTRQNENSQRTTESSNKDFRKETEPLVASKENGSARTLAERPNCCSGIKQLNFIFGLKNYTFPLYMPVKNFDSKLSSILKTLSFSNLSSRNDKPILAAENHNNNALQKNSEDQISSPKIQSKEDTSEFESDIKFLSTEPNKMSTPVKSMTLNLIQGEPQYVNSYEQLNKNLCRIFWQENPKPDIYKVEPHEYKQIKSSQGGYLLPRKWKASTELSHLSPYHNLDTPLSPVYNKDKQSPQFSNEDEEAVYYLITKYLKND